MNGAVKSLVWVGEAILGLIIAILVVRFTPNWGKATRFIVVIAICCVYEFLKKLILETREN